MNKIIGSCLFALLVLAVPARAAEHDHAGHGAPSALSDLEKNWEAALAKPSLAVSVAFDEQGRLWRAWSRDGHVQVSRSADLGNSWSSPVKVNAEAESIAADGENRPKIVVRGATVFVSYTQALEKPMTGHIRFSRSLDGGATFSPPITVNDDREVISHRFEAMSVNSRGQVFLAWLDKRDLSAAARKGEKYIGVGVYYAVSDDDGASFRPNTRAAEHSCECCRVAMALDVDGKPVIVWRHVFGKNSRDHALTKLETNAAPVRVSFDDWQVDACPHHGPALSIAGDGVYHLAWFNNAPASHGLFYAQSADGGKTMSAPVPFGNYDAQAGHPGVLSLGSGVFLAWREFTGEASEIFLMESTDGGKSWAAPRKIAATAGASDYPMLVAGGGKAYLSWNTAGEGYRLIEVVAGGRP